MRLRSGGKLFRGIRSEVQLDVSLSGIWFFDLCDTLFRRICLVCHVHLRQLYELVFVIKRPFEIIYKTLIERDLQPDFLPIADIIAACCSQIEVPNLHQ